MKKIGLTVLFFLYFQPASALFCSSLFRLGPAPSGSLDLFIENLQNLGVDWEINSIESETIHAYYSVYSAQNKRVVGISHEAARTGKISGVEIHELVHVFGDLAMNENHRGVNAFDIKLYGEILLKPDYVQEIKSEYDVDITTSNFEEPLAYISGIHYDRLKKLDWTERAENAYGGLFYNLMLQLKALEDLQFLLNMSSGHTKISFENDAITISKESLFGNVQIDFSPLPDSDMVFPIITLETPDLVMTVAVNSTIPRPKLGDDMSKVLQYISYFSEIASYQYDIERMQSVLRQGFYRPINVDYNRVQDELEAIQPPKIFQGF